MTSNGGRKKNKAFNIFVVSSLGPLPYTVLKKLSKEKNSKITLITNEEPSFKRFVEEKKLVRKILIQSASSLETLGPCDYFLYIESGFDREIFEKLLALVQKNQAKSVFIFPYNSIQENPALQGGDELNADMSSSFGEKPRSLERGGRHKIIDPERGDIGQKIELLEKTNLPYQIFLVGREFLEDKEKRDGSSIDQLALKRVGRFLLRNLFVFSYRRKRVAIETFGGKEQKEEEVTNNNFNYPYVDEKISLRTKPIKDTQKFYPNKNTIRKSFFKTNTFSLDKIFRKIKTASLTKDKVRKTKQKRTLRKKDFYYAGASLFLAIFILPSLLLAFTFLNLLIAGGWYFINRDTPSERTYALARFSSRTLGGYFEAVSYLPKTNVFFSGAKKYSSFLVKTSEIGIERNKINSLTKKLLQDLSEERGNIIGLSKELSLELDKYARDLGFWQNDLGGFNNYFQKLSLVMVGIEKPDELRSRISLLSKLSEEIPELLGFTSSKTYALIIQNEKIERPTGGKITSIALVTFSEGKISEIKTYNVGDLDSRLKGEVTPPEPIRKYYKEQWFLEDSNWDPDFAASAQKASWFLEKEAGVQIDGAIAVSTKLVNILKSPSYGNFNVLSGDKIGDEKLSGAFSKLSSNSRKKIFREIVEGLTDKDIQIFMKASIQETVGDLGWSGSMVSNSCGANCFNDLVAVINADLGTTNADSPVDKKVRLEISFEEAVVKRKMSIYLKNVSDKEQRNYIRIIAPTGVGFSQLILANGAQENIPLEISEDGFSEAGAFLVIKPYGELKGVLSWESGFKKKGNYQLSWIKQSGTSPLPISLVILPPRYTDLYSSENLTLTKESKLEYNTNLVKDAVFQFSWR